MMKKNTKKKMEDSFLLKLVLAVLESGSISSKSHSVGVRMQGKEISRLLA